MKNEKFIELSSLDARLIIKLIEIQKSAETAVYMGWNTAQVSNRLSKIEKKLGKVLFKRNRRLGKYIPTKEALKITQYLESIIQASELASGDIHTNDNHVKIASSHTMLEFYLGPYVRDLLDKNPDLRMDFHQKDDLIIESPDFNEIFMTWEINSRLSSIKYFPYHTFEQKLWASPDYIDKHGSPETIEDLYDHRLLLRKHTDEPKILFGSKYIKHYLKSTRDPNISSVTSARFIDTLCMSGCGIMAASEESARLAGYRIENIMPSFDGDTLDIYIGVHKEFLESDVAKKTINWIFECRNRSFRGIGVKPAFDFTPLK